MLRTAKSDLKSDEAWKRRKAEQKLANLDAAVSAGLRDWITKLLADPSNSARDYKIMRAHRHYLLRMEGPSVGYRRSWEKVAQRIRRRDGFKCMECGATDTTLDVHHIIYLSNYGTNRQNNLITLCRTCHEAEHGRIFNFAESQDPESIPPIQLMRGGQTLPFDPPQTVRTSEVLPASVPVGKSASGIGPEMLTAVGRLESARGSGADGVKQSGHLPSNAPRDCQIVRTELRAASADLSIAEKLSRAEFDSDVVGKESVSTPAQAHRYQVRNQQPNQLAVKTLLASWEQEQVAAMRTRSAQSWGVIIGGVILGIAAILLVINVLHS